jgi:hypothetical protein
MLRAYPSSDTGLALLHPDHVERIIIHKDNIRHLFKGVIPINSVNVLNESFNHQTYLVFAPTESKDCLVGIEAGNSDDTKDHSTK